MKPEIKYENGKIVAKASTMVDTDKDGQAAITASVVVEIDAAEAVGEIIKNEVPEWLKKLIATKG